MTIRKQNEFLTHDELFNAIENDPTDNNFKTCAEFLMESLNDWPTYNLKEPEDLIEELKSEIKDKLTFDNLDAYLKNLQIENNAWKMTSVTSILEMFDINRKNDFDKTTELEAIIDDLTQHYRKNIFEK